jgi:hypothetical protein
LAIAMDVPAIPVKPNSPAMIATTAKINAHLNMPDLLERQLR